MSIRVGGLIGASGVTWVNDVDEAGLGTGTDGTEGIALGPATGTGVEGVFDPTVDVAAGWFVEGRGVAADAAGGTEGGLGFDRVDVGVTTRVGGAADTGTGAAGDGRGVAAGVVGGTVFGTGADGTGNPEADLTKVAVAERVAWAVGMGRGTAVRETDWEDGCTSECADEVDVGLFVAGSLAGIEPEVDAGRNAGFGGTLGTPRGAAAAVAVRAFGGAPGPSPAPLTVDNWGVGAAGVFGVETASSSTEAASSVFR